MCFRRTYTFNDLQPRLLKYAQTAPLVHGVRIPDSTDETRYSRIYNRLSAWRCSALRGTGLECDVEGSALCAITGTSQRQHLGMCRTGLLVITGTNKHTLANHYCADRWIRAREPNALRGKRYRRFHPSFIP